MHLEKAKQSEIQFEHQKIVKVFKFYDKLPGALITDLSDIDGALA